MKKILLSIAVLLFLAAGLGISLLYSFGEKAIEEGIIGLSELESSTYESTAVEKTPETGLDTVKVEAGAEKPADNDIKENNTAIATAQPNNASKNISQAQENEDNSLKDKVSMSEKASLMKLLLSKLTKKDISELRGMLSNGITSTEKTRAKEILYSRLTAEDINKIKDAYIKYTQQK
ncbi:MAG: hypothetical protein ACYCYE_00550 [Clostridia bacterium]